ncbi:MAG: hypothetical protein RLZZ574_473 [Cyanobacteriota bacterium]
MKLKVKPISRKGRANNKMSQHDYNARIKRLEKKVSELTSIVEAAGLLDRFVPLSQAARQLKCNTWVIRQRIRNDGKVALGIHYQMNGNRYLINVVEWQALINSDAKAKHR